MQAKGKGTHRNQGMIRQVPHAWQLGKPNKGKKTKVQNFYRGPPDNKPSSGGRVATLLERDCNLLLLTFEFACGRIHDSAKVCFSKIYLNVCPMDAQGENGV